MDHAPVFQAGIIDSRALCIWNKAAVASLRDSKTVDGVTGCRGERGVNLLDRGVRADLAFLGQSPDGLS